jgi:hypothetical protein
MNGAYAVLTPYLQLGSVQAQEERKGRTLGYALHLLPAFA